MSHEYYASPLGLGVEDAQCFGAEKVYPEAKEDEGVQDSARFGKHLEGSGYCVDLVVVLSVRE